MARSRWSCALLHFYTTRLGETNGSRSSRARSVKAISQLNAHRIRMSNYPLVCLMEQPWIRDGKLLASFSTEFIPGGDIAIYIPYFRNKFISRLKRWPGDEKKILHVTGVIRF